MSSVHSSTQINMTIINLIHHGKTQTMHPLYLVERSWTLHTIIHLPYFPQFLNIGLPLSHVSAHFILQMTLLPSSLHFFFLFLFLSVSLCLSNASSSLQKKAAENTIFLTFEATMSNILWQSPTNIFPPHIYGIDT